MKSVLHDTVAPPVDAKSVLTNERLWTVALGNGVVVRFTSSRHAKAFQAETERMLSDAMMSANLLLIEAFTAYRLAWPYLDAKAAGPRQLFQDAESALDRATKGAWTANHAHFYWKALASALASVRELGLYLEKLYRDKSQGVQRHAMATLVKRATDLGEQLRSYGTDVVTADSHRPSPHAR